MKFLDKWKEFEAKAVDAAKRGKNERENMRRCFYSGAIAVLSMLETTDTDADDGGLEQVRSLMNEMNQFGREIMDEQQQRSTAKVRKEF